MTAHTRKLYLEAARIASKYNWPDESSILRNYTVPCGFAKEVGSAIALFTADVIPLLVAPPELENQAYTWEETRDEDKQVARELGRLRVLLATLSTNNKVTR